MFELLIHTFIAVTIAAIFLNLVLTYQPAVIHKIEGKTLPKLRILLTLAALSFCLYLSWMVLNHSMLL